ncbi:hypothetical protein NMG60_11007424 [Bertholletia excelsa]
MDMPENRARQHWFYLSKVAFEAGRVDDAVEFMDKVVAISAAAGDDLTEDEKDHFFSSYKKRILPLREALMSMSSNHGSLGSEYRSRIESELSCVCNRVLKLLDSHLIPTASASDSKVFYLRMKGDYYRYLAEIKREADSKAAAERAYTAAEKVAVADLSPIHHLRMGLALNFSIFYHDVLGEVKKGFFMALNAYNEALEEMRAQEKTVQGEASRVWHLLGDHCHDWSFHIEAIS